MTRTVEQDSDRLQATNQGQTEDVYQDLEAGTERPGAAARAAAAESGCRLAVVAEAGPEVR